MARLAFSTWMLVAAVCAACTGDSFEDVPPTGPGPGGGQGGAGQGGAGQAGTGKGGDAQGGVSGSSGQSGQAGQMSGAGGEAGGAGVAGGEGGQAGEAGQGGGPDAGSGGTAGTSGQGGTTAGQGGMTAAGQGGVAGQGGAGGAAAGQGGAAGGGAAGAAGGPSCTKKPIDLEQEADTLISNAVKLECGLISGAGSAGCVTIGSSQRALMRFKVPDAVVTKLQSSPQSVTLVLHLHFPFSCGSTNSKGVFQGQVFPLRTDWDEQSATWCDRKLPLGGTDTSWVEPGASAPGVDIGTQAAAFMVSVGQSTDITLPSAWFSGGNWLIDKKLAVRLSFDAQTAAYLAMHESPQEMARPRLTATYCE